uniref:CCHC-type domain-containing protein n=1 Tax=Knipowitschia caucasica TaxID=637954 RepID=A0AAV2LHA2_KNICA
MPSGKSGARPKIKKETGFSGGSARGQAPSAMIDRSPNSDENGGRERLQVKTPKYSGKADWEAFYAQFELLAGAAGCPAERDDYGALVGALRRRFGQCSQPDVLRSELASQQRLTGEPLRALANDIETLTRRAYAHMPPEVQSELARDQFIRALALRELRAQTQLAHPRFLQEALELALEREAVGSASEIGPIVRTAVREDSGQERPAWVAELTELIQAVTLQPQRGGARPRRGPPVCWTCGKAGHISVRCPQNSGGQGNAPGSV